MAAENALARLVAAHPKLFRGQEPPWSELPAGWYDLAHRCCLDLEALLGGQAHRWTARQSKEKLGSWRFYWRLEGVEEPHHADMFDTAVPDADVGTKAGEDPGTEVHVSRTPAGMRLSIVGADELSRAIHERVRAAETESERTCLYCGAPGTLWTDGWLHTACTAHKRPDALTPEDWRRRREAEQRARNMRRDRADE